MSGHSKWSKIKRAKEASDQKKSKLYGKLVRDIQVAARENPDPDSNASLRDAIARARKANMPQANIERLLSQKDSAQFSEIIYEGFGPGGIALLITAYTDSPNRTVSNLRHLFKEHGGQLGEPGSVKWKFKEEINFIFDQIPASKQDEFELALIDAGAEDILKEKNDQWRVTTTPDHMNTISDAAQSSKINVLEKQAHHLSHQAVSLTDDQRRSLETLLEELNEQEDIADVHTETIQ